MGFLLSKLKFDVLFIDVTTPRPYETATLDTEGVGGTEASLIRVAEALGSLGLKVAVVEHNLKMELLGHSVYYLPISQIDNIEADHVIMLRGVQYADLFPKAFKYSWHQDVPTHLMLKMRDMFLQHDVTVVGVSKWHKGAIQSMVCKLDELKNPNVTYIYNPVPDSLYVDKSVSVKYYPNKLVWPASPHKGLEYALELFKRLQELSKHKDWELHVFNPGYAYKELIRAPNVVVHGAVPARELWQHMSEALCVFYPTQFKETFGCIAAEANAVHCPVLTQEIAGLAETVASSNQYVKYDPKVIIDMVEDWRGGYRPKVHGQDRFRLSEIAVRWLKLFGKRERGE